MAVTPRSFSVVCSAAVSNVALTASSSVSSASLSSVLRPPRMADLGV